MKEDVNKEQKKEKLIEIKNVRFTEWYPFRLDLKSIVILFLVGISILFFSLWFLKGDNYKKEFKLLEKEFKNLQHTRDSLLRLNLKLKDYFDKTQKSIDERNKRILEIESQLNKSKILLNKANSELSRNKKDLENTKKKIENLKKNPIKREEEDLLNSLKEKLK